MMPLNVRTKPLTEREHATQKLFDFLSPLLRLTKDEETKLEELLDEYVTAIADERAQDSMDRKFHEGAYRS